MAKEEAQVLRRGTDEIDFMKSRARASVRKPELARQKTTDLVRRVLSSDGAAGGEAHDQGTELIELYMSHADAALDYPSFRAFLEAEWPLDLSLAYERMRIARLCTHDQAARHGFTACQLGLRIMRTLGINSFEDFLRRPLPLHPSDGGGTVRFPAPTRQLRSVLRQLGTLGAAGGDGDDEGEAVDVAHQFRRYRETVDTLTENDPGVAALKPVVWANAQGAFVRVSVCGPAQAGAAARLYQRLAKLRF